MRLRLAAAALTAGLAVTPVSASAQGVDPLTMDPHSWMTTPVYLANGNQRVSQGTGFFYAIMEPDGLHAKTVFLVTNYHVITGHNPIAPGPKLGDRVVFFFHTDKTNPSEVRQVELPLYTKAGVPMWVQSTTHPEADVILLPVPVAAYSTPPQANVVVFIEQHTEGNIKVRPTSETALLGYPYGFFDTKNFLPVWKTGDVASEPSVDFQGDPVFLVDVSAFPGMSGSPVLATANGVYETLDGRMTTGTMAKLMGIFSAMRVLRRDASANSQGLDAGDTSLQLGYVWKASLIVEIAKAYDNK